MERQFLLRGVPVVGRTGWKLNSLMERAGIKRTDVFLDNTLRCVSPRNKLGQMYPTGAAKVQAERHCRVYDRLVDFAPSAVVITMHPATILREATPEPLIEADLRKAQSFVRQGHRVLVLMGAHAIDVFMGSYATTIARWRGHYQVVKGTAVEWYERVIARLDARAKKGGKKTKKASKIKQIEKGLTLAGNASNVTGNEGDIQDVIDPLDPLVALPRAKKKRVRKKKGLQPSAADHNILGVDAAANEGENRTNL
jgi:uracil-DNA glycosylase